MRFRRQPRVQRIGAGRYTLALPEAERGLLADLVEQLRDVLLVTTDDPMLRRLFPTGYHEDPDRDREYQQLVHDELLAHRLAALATLEASVQADELDEAGLTGWLTALNDLRLVLGTRLGVTEDSYDDFAGDPGMALYGWLTWVQGEIVEALSAAL